MGVSDDALVDALGSWKKVPEDSPAYRVGRRWIITAPDGSKGSLTADSHTVTEHEDGTITVEPSLVMPSGWHGWLRRGRFTVA